MSVKETHVETKIIREMGKKCFCLQVIDIDFRKPIIKISNYFWQTKYKKRTQNNICPTSRKFFFSNFSLCLNFCTFRIGLKLRLAIKNWICLSFLFHFIPKCIFCFVFWILHLIYFQINFSAYSRIYFVIISFLFVYLQIDCRILRLLKYILKIFLKYRRF